MNKEIHSMSSDQTVPKVCAESDCAEPVFVRGLCKRHYHRRWAAEKRPPKASGASVRDLCCSVDECGDSGYAQWPGESGVLCRRHYDRLRRRGTVGDPRRGGGFPECAEDGCARPARSRRPGALCGAHHQQEMRRARGLQKPGPKPDPAKARSRYGAARANEGTRDGVVGRPAKDWAAATHCRRGHALTPENTYQRNRGGRLVKICRRCNRDAQIRLNYGLEPEDWDALLISQAGRCAVCADPMQVPYVDHDHETGKVRALLCRDCNTMLGYAQDDPAILRGAVEYLERYAQGHDHR